MALQPVGWAFIQEGEEPPEREEKQRDGGREVERVLCSRSTAAACCRS